MYPKNNEQEGKDNRRAERRIQKDKKKKQAREIYPWDDEADHIKHCCRNPQKTRQELKMELNQEEDFDYTSF